MRFFFQLLHSKFRTKWAFLFVLRMVVPVIADSFPAYSQQCADDAGPPFADDESTFGVGGRYHDGSSATPVLTEDGQCVARMRTGCDFQGGNAKAAYIEGPLDCGGNGWYCRILEDLNVEPVNLIGDLNFGYCNTTEGRDDAGYDRSGHCHGSSDDTTYYWWMRDHWHRRYNGRLRCCCGWYNSNDEDGIQPAMVDGKITNRCDYRRLVVDEEDANSCRDANEDHGLGYEGGCKGNTPVDTPLVENDNQCWELLHFGDGAGKNGDGPSTPSAPSGGGDGEPTTPSAPSGGFGGEPSGGDNVGEEGVLDALCERLPFCMLCQLRSSGTRTRVRDRSREIFPRPVTHEKEKGSIRRRDRLRLRRQG